MENLTCIIILNWNGVEDTKKCIRSLLKAKSPDYKIIVVDNGSKDDEVTALSREFGRKIEIFGLPKNTGFTGGVNFGVKQAFKFNPDYILLLNNDTEVEPDFLFHLVNRAESNPKIGIVGPVIYDFKNRNKVVYSGGRFNWFLGASRHLEDKPSEFRITEFVNGGCFLIKINLVHEIGLLDNRFFAYFEDIAYSLTARRKGYLCVCEPKAKIYHVVSASSDKKGKFLTYLISRNRILFINNYSPLYIRIYFFFFNFLKLIVAVVYFSATRQFHRASAFCKGYIDGNLGRGGPPSL